MTAELALRSDLSACEEIIARGLKDESSQPEQLAYWEARMELALARRPEKRSGVKRTNKQPHVVYTFRAASGEALYVGISLTLAGRLSSHSQNGWFQEVRHIDVEHLPDRAAALARESELIGSLRPRRNVAGLPR